MLEDDRLHSLHQNHFGLITNAFVFKNKTKQIALALVGNKQIVYTHVSREKEKGFHLFAMSLGLQKHPTGFTCLSTDFPFSGVLYWCNGSRNHYAWISLHLPNMRARQGMWENE